MNERPIDELLLEEEALRGVREIKEVAIAHKRFFSPDIEVVLVFSGEEEGLRWIDPDRIRAGVGVVREVTASNMNTTLGGEVKGHKVTQDHITLHGPYFVYSGVPKANKALREALKSQTNKLPEVKMIIIDEVAEDDGTTHPIMHTDDQFKSFFQEITKPGSRLSSVRNVALVAHYSDFVTYPFYAQEFNRDLRENGFEGLNFWAYGIKDRLGAGEELVRDELHRLVEFVKHGDLPAEPLTFRISQSEAELPSQDKQIGK